MSDREAILQRRRRFIALALAGGAAATAAGCDPCLRIAPDVGGDAGFDGGTTAGPDACLRIDVGRDDAPAEPVDAPIEPDAGDPGTDAGTDAGDLDAGMALPCLTPPPSDPSD